MNTVTGIKGRRYSSAVKNKIKKIAAWKESEERHPQSLETHVHRNSNWKKSRAVTTVGQIWMHAEANPVLVARRIRSRSLMVVFKISKLTAVLKA